MKRFYVVLSLLVGAFVAMPQSVEAKIRCNGPYQIIQGSEHATPYCEDNFLARVARQYGVRVSGRQVRNNPFAKEDACRVAGHDIRVRDICAGEFGRGNRRWP